MDYHWECRNWQLQFHTHYRLIEESHPHQCVTFCLTTESSPGCDCWGHCRCHHHPCRYTDNHRGRIECCHHCGYHNPVQYALKLWLYWSQQYRDWQRLDSEQ